MVSGTHGLASPAGGQGAQGMSKGKAEHMMAALLRPKSQRAITAARHLVWRFSLGCSTAEDAPIRIFFLNLHRDYSLIAAISPLKRICFQCDVGKPGEDGGVGAQHGAAVDRVKLLFRRIRPERPCLDFSGGREGDIGDRRMPCGSGPLCHAVTHRCASRDIHDAHCDGIVAKCDGFNPIVMLRLRLPPDSTARGQRRHPVCCHARTIDSGRP
jgi:hypothetical protein